MASRVVDLTVPLAEAAATGLDPVGHKSVALHQKKAHLFL